ncbi:MAG TPA: hypothetical protein DCR93_23440 [Cytophagales bacterium]|nr:hypothetical protein [Cytophagales bacterium]HAP62322.1 hypothetical protein [Cytophagales bacterium]
MAIHIKELHVRIHGGKAATGGEDEDEQEDKATPKDDCYEERMSEQAMRKAIAEEVKNQLAKQKRR